MEIEKSSPDAGKKITPSPARRKLLDAALYAIRAKGYAATTVDDICRQAGVTKGSFFHHFKSKDDLAIAAIVHWRAMTEGIFASAAYHQAADPLDRLLGYLEFRKLILMGDIPSYTCPLGTLVQETYETHPEIRKACEQGLTSHIADLTRDVGAAKTLHAPEASWSVEGVASFIQAVLQGSFIFAKAQQDSAIVRENLEHVRRYLRYLFEPQETSPVLPQIYSEQEDQHDHSKSHYTD